MTSLLRRSFGFRRVVCYPSFISSNDRVEKFISMSLQRLKNSCPASTRFNMCSSVSCFGIHLADSFRYPRVPVIVSCSRYITESSSNFRFFPQFRLSQLKVFRSSDHHAPTFLNTRPHLYTLVRFISLIAICSFHLINLKLRFSLPNEITDDAAYFALGGRLD